MPDYGPKTYNCLTGCVGKYASSNDVVVDEVPFLFGDQAENFAPYIWAKINNGSNEITVGNESYPYNPNKAIIKSLEAGFINQIDGSMEIVDEEGGQLSVFLDSVQKCGSRFNVGSTLEFELGWVYSKCDGSKDIRRSPRISAVILAVSSNLSNGLIKFIVKFASGAPLAQQVRHDDTFGQEKSGQKEHLEDAISALAARPPSIIVRYAYYDQSNKLKFTSFDWVNHGKKGPKAIWHGDSQNKYSTIAKWVAPFRVNDGKKGKGVILVHNPDKHDELVVLMDPSPSCGEKVNPQIFGTFIVNGGKCSSVLEFSPTFDFISAMGYFSSGGSTKGGISSKQSKKEDPQVKTIVCDENEKQVGITSQVSPDQSSFSAEGLSAPDSVNKSSEAHMKASRLVDVQGSPIIAELKIVGNIRPELYQILQGLMCSIVVINPNYISGGKTGESCGDFLKKADCNPFYSNKNWLIMGANHTIQEGSFVTTLKVVLSVPGVELSTSSTLGASETGIKVRGTCSG
jgi:hypothetical protein